MKTKGYFVVATHPQYDKAVHGFFDETQKGEIAGFVRNSGLHLLSVAKCEIEWEPGTMDHVSKIISADGEVIGTTDG